MESRRFPTRRSPARISPTFVEAFTPERFDIGDFGIGMMVLKPDAYELGMVDPLLSMVCDKLHEKMGIEYPMFAVNIVEPQKDIFNKLYPDQWEWLLQKYPDGYRYMSEYLGRGPIVIAAFQGNGKFSMSKYLNELRGPRLDRVNHANSIESLAFSRTIRGMVPIPGSPKDLSEVVSAIRTGTLIVNDQISSLNPAIRGAVQENLVHVPETDAQIKAAISLLNSEDRNRVMKYLERCFRESSRKSP